MAAYFGRKKVERSTRVISKIHWFVELNHWFVELIHLFVELNHWFVEQNRIREFGSLLCEESGTFEKGYFKNSFLFSSTRKNGSFILLEHNVCRTKSLICRTKSHQRIWQITLRGERLISRKLFSFNFWHCCMYNLSGPLILKGLKKLS